MSITENESGVSSATAFCWTFPGAPIRINVPLALLSKLGAELDQLDSSAGRVPGAESGGVLIGHHKNPVTVEIDDYRWVTSEQRPGSQFSLDPTELERLRSEYDGRKDSGGAGSAVAGFFRTHSKDNLRLREEELAFVQEHFRFPTDVVLLIQTSTKPRTAGFFFWMDSSTFSPFSFRDFVLDAKALEMHARPTRTPIVPEPLPGNFETPVPALPPETAEHDLPPPGEMDSAPPMDPARLSLRRKIAAVLAAAILTIAGVSVYEIRLHWFSRPKTQAAAPAAAVVAFPLRLEVEAQGGGLNVRWNPQSDAVAHARDGQLTILEAGKDPRVIPLDAPQLAGGHVFYQSAAERLQFELEIVDQSGKVSKESILALSAPAPPVPAASQTPQSGAAPAASSPAVNAQTQQAQRKVVNIPVASAPPVSPQVAAAAPEPVRRPPAPRAFTPPSRAPSPAPVMPIDTPPAIPNGETLTPAIQLPQVAGPPPAGPPANSTATNQASAAKTVRVGGNIQAANLIKRVTPVYPPAALMARVQGNVRFTALIGKDGSVRNLQAVSGSPTLSQAAADAVKQWVYRPTLLNGEPVEVITQIDVLFTLNP